MKLYETHNDVLEGKKLPHLGDTVKSRRYGTLWRVVEEKEVWQNTDDDPDTGEPRVIPAINICYCRLKGRNTLDAGKKICYQYTLHDNTFEANWELLGKKPH